MRNRIVVLLFVLLPLATVSADWTIGPYGYDGAGNITSIGRGSGAPDTFVYDAFGRVTAVSVAGQAQQFTYDGFGNLRTITTGNTTIALGVDPTTNRLSQSIDPNGQPLNAWATYDAAGQLKQWQTSGGSYEWDAVGMIAESSSGVPGDPDKVYLYTANGERIATVNVVNGVESSSEWTLRDASGKVLRRLDKYRDDSEWKWRWRQDYVYLDDQLLASEVDTSEETRHYFPDHLGTPRRITGNGGVAIAEHAYLPFGTEITPANQDPERLKFTGHERDASGLDYMHARYYSAGVGRFLSVDPALDLERHLRKPQGWNRYSYVENNPVRNIDPTGRLVDIVIDGAFILYDLADIAAAKIAGEQVSKTQMAALAADLGAAAVPFATGGGLVVRLGSKADDVAKTAVYVSRNADEVVQYVGITNNLTRRAAEHAATKGIEITSLKGLENLSRADARAVEQTLIEIHKLAKDGGTLMNKINSIAKTNEKYAEALRRGYELLNEAGYLIR